MAAFGAVLFLSLLKIIFADNTDILIPTKRCVATGTQLGACHVCVCKTDGVFHCRRIKCNIYNTSTNDAERAGFNFHSLPEIHDGEPCLPDRIYKMDCNTCRCTVDQSLMCTKMACVNWKNLKAHKEGKKALRNEEDGSEKVYLPKVQQGTACTPGKLYRSKCKRCYCTADNKLVCSKNPKDACTFDKYGNPPPILKPEDVHPAFKPTEAKNLPTLPSASEQCTPGKSYAVDCNTCICLDSANLLCQKKLCLSYDDMNRIEAKEMSGKPCTVNSLIKSENCKACKCEEGKTVCYTISDCSVKPSVLLLNDQEQPPEEMDPDTDRVKCLPGTIYKTDCNKCYCQEDGSLRCTQKTCLNFSQVKILEEQREYLEKHGL